MLIHRFCLVQSFAYWEVVLTLWTEEISVESCERALPELFNQFKTAEDCYRLMTKLENMANLSWKEISRGTCMDQVLMSGSWDRVPRWSPHSVLSHLLPLPLPPPPHHCTCIKSLKKKTEKRRWGKRHVLKILLMSYLPMIMRKDQ